MSLTPIPQAVHDKGAPASDCGTVAHSKRAKWRAASLIGVHLLVFAHILHWVRNGRTLTPVEPSEAMQTLEQGVVNAGFLLFLALILSTLVFGRFFCGWACHVVAYQDLCGWLLKRMGMRPKPFRSRLLVFVPLFAALYMFVWPQVLRLWEGRPMPTFVYHLTTDDFWATFPGPAVTILTFAVCGFGLVWLLGNKGFCTYGCPYGAIFYHADQVAPGKIRVTDACDGCGHCTATCTSNVIVHQEVAAHGMVVDAGCMKCLDCVDVCPKQALYFGFGAPSVAKGKPKTKRPRRTYDYTLPEELGLAAAFVACLYAFRSLYDTIPFLLTLGLAAGGSVMLLTAARSLYAPHVRLQRMQLRAGGRLSASGRGYLVFATLLVALVGHSASIQYHTRQGAARHATAVAAFEKGEGETGQTHAMEALDNLRWASKNGLLPVARVEAMIGNLESRLGRPGLAVDHLKRAAELKPMDAEIQRTLARTLAGLRRFEEAEGALRAAMEADPTSIGALGDLAALLTQLGRPAESAEAWLKVAAQHPDDPSPHLNAALTLAGAGQLEAAEASAREAVRLDDASAHAHHTLALILAEQGDTDAALAEATRAAELGPTLVAAHIVLARLCLERGDTQAALSHAERAKGLQPTNPEALSVWAAAHAAAGSLGDAVRTALSLGATRDEERYAAAFLYRQRGDTTAVQTLMRSLARTHPDWPSP